MEADIKKAAYKTAIIFFILFALLCLSEIFFHSSKYIFNSFLFKEEVIQRKLWRDINLFLTLFILSGSGIVGYIIAKKKNRNAHNWAGICFITSIWGLIFLGFLPPIKEEKTQQPNQR